MTHTSRRGFFCAYQRPRTQNEKPRYTNNVIKNVIILALPYIVKFLTIFCRLFVAAMVKIKTTVGTVDTVDTVANVDIKRENVLSIYIFYHISTVKRY